MMMAAELCGTAADDLSPVRMVTSQERTPGLLVLCSLDVLTASTSTAAYSWLLLAGCFLLSSSSSVSCPLSSCSSSSSSAKRRLFLLAGPPSAEPGLADGDSTVRWWRSGAARSLCCRARSA